MLVVFVHMGVIYSLFLRNVNTVFCTSITELELENNIYFDKKGHMRIFLCKT